MATKIQNQIEESITEMICISEMTKMINRFITGVELLNISPNELKAVFDLLKKLDGKTKNRIN